MESYAVGSIESRCPGKHESDAFVENGIAALP
jgi:hypothetical protein